MYVTCNKASIHNHELQYQYSVFLLVEQVAWLMHFRCCLCILCSKKALVLPSYFKWCVPWDVTLCWLSVSGHFEATLCLHGRGQIVKEEWISWTSWWHCISLKHGETPSDTLWYLTRPEFLTHCCGHPQILHCTCCLLSLRRRKRGFHDPLRVGLSSLFILFGWSSNSIASLMSQSM